MIFLSVFSFVVLTFLIFKYAINHKNFTIFISNKKEDEN